MNEVNRQFTRYEEIGKVNAPQLCALPGILDDISVSGCKIHYSFKVPVDMETEYEIKLSPLHHGDQTPLNLICLPQWVDESNENTVIGFKILYSPDANRLKTFIEQLENLSKNQFPEII